jgi:hypothetical protein
MVFILSSCEDPLGIENTLKSGEITLTAPELYPPRDMTYHSITLYWSEFKDTGFDRYEIYTSDYYFKKASLYLIIRDPKICFAPVENLPPNWDINVFIRVINKDGALADSKTLTFKTYSDIPSPVTNFNYKIMNNDTNIYEIYWDKYSDSKIAPFSRYEVHYSKEQYFQLTPETLRESITMPDHNFSLFDKNRLDKNTLYSFKVRIYNTLEKYSESSYLTIRTP